MASCKYYFIVWTFYKKDKDGNKTELTFKMRDALRFSKKEDAIKYGLRHQLSFNNPVQNFEVEEFILI